MYKQVFFLELLIIGIISKKTFLFYEDKIKALVEKNIKNEGGYLNGRL